MFYRSFSHLSYTNSLSPPLSLSLSFSRPPSYTAHLFAISVFLYIYVLIFFFVNYKYFMLRLLQLIILCIFHCKNVKLVSLKQVCEQDIFNTSSTQDWINSWKNEETVSLCWQYIQQLQENSEHFSKL